MPWYERLQQKWKVNGVQLTLILITFAVGGSLTGQVAKWVMDALNLGGGLVLGTTLLIDSHCFMADHGAVGQSANGTIPLLPELYQ